MATVKRDSNLLLPHTLWQSLQDTASYLQQPVAQIHWVVALSGGKDSSALAYAMAKLPTTLANVSLIHIHHGLQQEADGWVSHCRLFAQSLDFSFYTEKVNVNTSARVSIEASAREARYKALRHYCRGHNGVLIIAQHEDDQLETVLLQLKRGAGPKGLSGMGKRQRIDGVLQIRPWLELPQRTIVDYISANQVPHINDPSNKDTQYDRNFLRTDVLPLLTQRWPGMAKAVNRTATLCAQQNALIEEQVRTWLSEQSIIFNTLPLSSFLKLSVAWQAETLRVWIKQRSGMVPSYEQLNEFLTTLHSPLDKIPELVVGRIHLRRFSGHIYFVDQPQKTLSPKDRISKRLFYGADGHFIESFCYDIQLGSGVKAGTTASRISTPTTLYELNVPKNSRVEVTYITIDDRVQVCGTKTKSAKRLFKEKKVPPWCRDNILLLSCDGVATVFIHASGVTPLTKEQYVNTGSIPASLVVLRRTEPYQHV